MPTYTYRCTKCSTEYEVFQSMSDPPLKRCRKCRGALRRTFHPVGIVLKGSGFHRTDYRSKPSPDRGDKEAEKKSEAASKTDSGSKSEKSRPEKGGSKGSEGRSEG